MVDKVKLLIAALCVVAGVAGFYFLQEQPAVLKLASVLVGVLLAAGVVWTTELGKRFFAFWKDSWREAKKVVWPTRNETIQTTGLVIAFAIVMALFLWMVDASLMFIIDILMGRVD